jgi:threo-3-hydroxy-L-aspartate ammonia-lyase
MTEPLVTIDEIRAAAARVRPAIARTPLVRAGAGRDPQRPFHLKCEHFQPMGAFKLRGAYNVLAQLSPEERARGVIAYSSGNHGQAVALSAQRLGMRAVVVMPETAPAVKVAGTRKYGAEVIFAGRTSDDRRARAEAEAAAHGYVVVPPFDHRQIIAGAGTVGLEIVEALADLSAVYVPVGGGGLLSGVAAAVKGLRPSVRVVGVEPPGAASMGSSRAAGAPVTLASTASIADGLLSLRPGDLTFAHAQALVDEMVTVSDEAIRDAVRWLHREAGLVVEPSGATATAAVLADGPAADGVVAVVSGGNVEVEAFAKYAGLAEPESAD